MVVVVVVVDVVVVLCGWRYWSCCITLAIGLVARGIMITCAKLGFMIASAKLAATGVGRGW